MAPQTAKSLMKEFRASFRRKKVVDPAVKASNAMKEAEEAELSKLIELKENLGNDLPPYSDVKLLSFLRARNLNVKEGEKLVHLDQNVMRLLKIDTYQPPQTLSPYNFTSIIGCDKEGSVVRVINGGAADIKGIVNMMSTIEGLKILIWMVNRDLRVQEEENKKSGRKCTQFVYILNLEDLSMSQITFKPAFDTAMQILKLLQDHFHDALKAVYFVNAPAFFASVFKLFKPAIQESLQQKIKIFDQGHGVDELLKIIDADVLPKYLGGDRVDSNGDPRCTEFLPGGTPVPESSYVTNFLDPDDPDVTVVSVPAGATLNFRFPARKIGSIFRWHIQGKDNDIGIGVFLEPFPSGTETPRTRKKREEDMSKFQQLTPIIRSQCHICPEEGSAPLWFTGNVIIHFDNSYSWMNSKEVYFKINIEPPTDTKEKNSSGHTLTRAFGQMSLQKS